jgi:GAF domain-containing protein
MWEKGNYKELQGSEFWDALSRELGFLLSNSDAPITTLSNAAAFLFNTLERINWAGFYLYDGEKLRLGPFGGKPACTEIAMGKGVCGTAAEKMQTIVVEDVEKFPGHIYCDADSRSEIVIPLVLPDGKLLGVLDIDSPDISRFGTSEKNGLEEIVRVIMNSLPEDIRFF